MAIRGKMGWLLVHIVVVGVGIAAGLMYRGVAGSSGTAWPPSIFPIGAIFGVVGVVLASGVQAINPRSARVWMKPNWGMNPFSARQPLQLFELAGAYFVAFGLSAVGAAFARSDTTWSSPLLSVCVGVGILLGVRSSLVLYRSKFDKR